MHSGTVGAMAGRRALTVMLAAAALCASLDGGLVRVKGYSRCSTA